MIYWQKKSPSASNYRSNISSMQVLLFSINKLRDLIKCRIFQTYIYTFLCTSVIPKQMIGPKTNSCRHISVLRHTFITLKIVAVVYILYIE